MEDENSQREPDFNPHVAQDEIDEHEKVQLARKEKDQEAKSIKTKTRESS